MRRLRQLRVGFKLIFFNNQPRQKKFSILKPDRYRAQKRFTIKIYIKKRFSLLRFYWNINYPGCVKPAVPHFPNISNCYIHISYGKVKSSIN